VRFIVLNKVAGTRSQLAKHPIETIAVQWIDDIIAQIAKVAHIATIRVVSL